MRISAPVYRLKRRARRLSREDGIPLNEALNSVAVAEGYCSWSLLAAKASATAPSRDLFASLKRGDLVLLGARPGQGKTLMALELIVEAISSGNRGVLFTLEYTEGDVADRFRAIGSDPSGFGELFELDNSDGINSDTIIDRLQSASAGTLVVVDYLQLLDQRRTNPDLMTQIRAMKSFAGARGLIVVFLSQIDRSYDQTVRPVPELADVRLPNPLDLTLFDQTCFLNEGAVQIGAAG